MGGHWGWHHQHPLKSPCLQQTYSSLHFFPFSAVSVWCRSTVHKCFWWQLGVQNLLSSQPLTTKTLNASVSLSIVFWLIVSCMLVTSFPSLCPLFQVQYNDAQSGKDYVTYLTLSPVQMTFHGTGSTLQASHDQVCVCSRVWYIVRTKIPITPPKFGNFGELDGFRLYVCVDTHSGQSYPK